MGEKIRDIRVFKNSRMNLDDDVSLLQPFETLEVWNSMISVGKNSEGRLNKHLGTVNAFELPVNRDFMGLFPSGVFTCVGTRDNVEKEEIIYALCDVSGTNHCLFSLSIKDYSLSWILRAEPMLGFRKDWMLDSDVIQGLYYWTFGYFGSYLDNDLNPPRKINVEKARKYTAALTSRWEFTAVSKWVSGSDDITYYVGSTQPPYVDGDKIVAWCMDGINHYKNSTGYCTVIGVANLSGTWVVYTDRPWQETTIINKIIDGYILDYDTDMYFGIDWQTLDRAMYSPPFQPTGAYGSDATIKSNNLRNDLFQFAYRWVYFDNERSVWSDISKVILPTAPERINGTVDESIIQDNLIELWYDTGSMDVVKVEIAFRKGNTGNWMLAHTESKYNENGDCLLSSGIYHSYKFFNTQLSVPLDKKEVLLPYHAVPQVASRQNTVEKSRIVDANYVEGYNNIDLDVLLELHKIPISYKGISSVYTDFTDRIVANNNLVSWYFGGPYNEFRGFDCAVVDLEPFFELGYDYTIYIDAYNENAGIYYYTDWVNPDPLANIAYPLENKNDRIISFATTYADTTDTIKTVINRLIFQLRSGDGGSHSAIAFCSYKNRLQNYDVWGSAIQQAAFPPDNTYYLNGVGEIGVIIRPAVVLGEWDPQQPYDHDLISIKVIKSQKKEKDTTLKSGAIHPLGQIYYDRTGSRCGAVNTNKDMKLFIPYETQPGVNIINKNVLKYTIDHVPPPEAVYWSFAYPGNTSMDYYVWGYVAANNIQIASGYTNLLDAFQFTFNANIMDTRELFPKFNIASYVWKPGDRVRFMYNQDGSNNYHRLLVDLDFEILGTKLPGDSTSYLRDNNKTAANGMQGDFILDEKGNKMPDIAESKFLINRFDVSSFIEKGAVVQIYRPKKVAEEIVWHQFGHKKRILFPNTEYRCHEGGTDSDALSKSFQANQNVYNGRSLSPARGIIWDGDAYLYVRFMGDIFPCESNSYSDFFDSKDFSIGKINVQDENMRRVQYFSKIIFSGKFIQNTRINDLSNVDSLDSVELPAKFGAIMSMLEVGFTLKVLQVSAPSSIFIGRAGVTQPTTSAKQILSSTEEVLGTLIPSESDEGTSHPESVCKFENQLFYYNIYSGNINRDSGNGIQSLSKDYKIDAFIKEKSMLFRESGIENVKVVSCYDERNNVMMMSFMDSVTPANSFTLAFRNSSKQEEEGFIAFFNILPDSYGKLKQTFTSFKDGSLWIHNIGLPCNFYGVQYGASVSVPSNKNAVTVKRYMSVAQSGNKVWHSDNPGDITIPITDTYRRGAVSLIKGASYVPREGKFVADFMRNMVTGSDTPSIEELVTGDELKGQVLIMTLHNDGPEEANLFAIEINAIESK